MLKSGKVPRTGAKPNACGDVVVQTASSYGSGALCGKVRTKGRRRLPRFYREDLSACHLGQWLRRLVITVSKHAA